LSDDEGPIGIEELEARLCSLAPRAEFVARMALRLRFYDIYDKKSYFACLAALIKELRLTAEGLSAVRADAQKVAAQLNTGDLAGGNLANDLDQRTAASTEDAALEPQNADFCSRQQR